MNQLQKDLKVALKWHKWIPFKYMTKEDMEVFHRLTNYSNKNLDYETYK